MQNKLTKLKYLPNNFEIIGMAIMDLYISGKNMLEKLTLEMDEQETFLLY